LGINILILSVFLLISFSYAFTKDLCTDCHKPHFKNESCIICHRGNPNTRRLDIAHENIISGKYLLYKIEGKTAKDSVNLINQLGCRRCHIVGKNGNRKGNNLNNIMIKKTIKNIRDSILNPSDYMPNFNLSEENIVLLINGLLLESEKGDYKGGKNFFYIKRDLKENLFNKKCGKCHKLISDKTGPIGKGDIAPNLSSIFSQYYPKTKNLKLNTPEELIKFLKNPRYHNRSNIMPVVEIKKKEAEEIIKLLY